MNHVTTVISDNEDISPRSSSITSLPRDAIWVSKIDPGGIVECYKIETGAKIMEINGEQIKLAAINGN